MNLNFAIAFSCRNTGCLVRFTNETEAVEAVYAAPVLDYEILIRNGDLVAVDLEPKPPRVVFRWMMTRVAKVEEGRVFTVEGSVQPVPLAETLQVELAEGDLVFIANGVICDVSTNDMPAHPELLRSIFFPQIEQMYQRLDQYLGLDPKQVVKEGYDQVAGSYLEMMQTTRVEERARYTSYLIEQVPAGADLLEIGCGAGLLTTQELAKKFKVTGVDISASQIALARQNVPQARLIQADITQLDFPPGSFDAIASFYTLIHIPREEQRKLVNDIARWLRPGGILVVTMGITSARNDFADDFLGARMYWSSFDQRANIQMIQDARMQIVRAQEETDFEFDQPVTFLWVIAKKPKIT